MRAARRLAALALATALLATVPAAHGDEIDLDVEIPEIAEGPFEVMDAQLRWGINEEAGSGAFAGGCNYLVAGAVGNTGGSKVWTEKDGYFRANEGAVSIIKPVVTSAGLRYRPATFADRCKDAQGRTVSASGRFGTGIQFVIDEGKGTVDPVSGDATISWEGSVTVVFYGGLTYWWFTDPVLEISGGRGTLTAMAGGYGSSRDDMDQWDRLEPTRITLADLSGVSLRGGKGFTAQPAYRGVEVDVPADAPAQLRTGDDWGAFPQDFVDFQQLTGQQAFWYSSGGARDVAKPAVPLVVSYDAQDPQKPEDLDRKERKEPRDADDDEATPTNPVKRPPVNPAPPPGDTTAAVSGAAVSALPAAVPSVTVLPAAPVGVAAEPPTLAETGTAPRGIVLGAAAVLLGAALTVLGYRRSWLVWPGRKESA